jgi:hypothetical protein
MGDRRNIDWKIQHKNTAGIRSNTSIETRRGLKGAAVLGNQRGKMYA